MKNKIKCILMIFIMFISVALCGCELIDTDMSIYLKKPVVTLEYDDKKVDISVKEYITAYNNYGLQLIQDSSYTVEQAQDATIEALINKYVLLEEAKKIITFDTTDKNELWNSTYDSLVSNLDTYAEEVRTKKNLTATDPESSDEETEKIVFNEYERKAYVVKEGNNYVIKVVNNSEDRQDAPAKNIADMQSVLFKQYSTDGNQIEKEAMKTYIKQLKLNEDGLKLSTDDVSVFKREVERIYKIHEESLYTTKLKNYYVYGDSQGVNDDYISTISVSQVLKKYRALMLLSKTLNTANAETYNKNMLESYKDVNYVVDDNYFFVSHILLKFTTEQQATYDSLETMYKTGELTPAMYQERLDNLYGSVGAITRDSEGEIIDQDRVNANVLLNSINAQLDAVSGENADEQKAEIFNNLVYKHNEDSGIMNAEYPYIIGTNDSKMVESFTEASRELNDQGEFGKISGLVRSNYGIHIVFYAGKVENAITIPDNTEFVIGDEDILKLTETKLSPFNSKTIFDKVYDLLVSDNYSQFESMQVNTLKSEIKITKHVSNYKR